MRTFNVRLAAILLVIAVVFCGSAYFVHGWQVKRNAVVFLAAAERAERDAAEAAKKKDLDAEKEANKEALKCLSWYVQLRPDDSKALEKLGLMLAKQSYEGNDIKSPRGFQNAFSLLERTVRQSPDRQTARRELVKMSMLPRVRRYQDAKEHLEGFLLKESPKDPELLELLGQCQVQLGDYNLALETLKKAIKYGPDRFTAYVQLASLLRYRLSRPKDADQWMDTLVTANPKSAQAHLMRGEYQLTIDAPDSIDKAAKEAAKALQLAPDDADVLGLAARCALIRRPPKLDEARGYVTRGAELYPSNFAMHGTLADIELLAGHRDKAVTVLQKGLKATNRHPELLWKLVNLLIDDKDLKAARQIIEEMRGKETSRSIPDYLVDYLAARIELVQGHWLAARQGFEKIKDAMVVNPRLAKQVYLWIAMCYGQSGDRDQQVLALRQALRIDPSYGPAQDAYSRLMMSMGKTSELPKYKVSDPGILMQLVRTLIAETSRQELSQQNWTPVESALEKAEKAIPGAPELVQLRSQVLVARNHPAEAEKLLRGAIEKNPKQAGLWASLAALLERQGDWEPVEKVLAESQKALGDSVMQRVIQANYLAMRYGKEAKDRLRKLAESSDKLSEADRLQLWSGLLEPTAEAGDMQQVELYCRKIAEKQPDNAQIRYMQFRLALMSGDQTAMQKVLDDIQHVAGQSAYWLWGKAILLGMQSVKEKDPQPTLAQALKYLVKAREMNGDWSPIPLAMARIYDQQGSPNLALKNYLEAMDLGDRAPGTIRRAIQILYQTQQYKEADQRLRWLEKQRVPFSGDLLQICAEVAMQRQDYDRALTMVKKVAAGDSKNYREQIWLGQMLSIIGSRIKSDGRDKEAAQLFADAEAALRRAVVMEPKLTTTWTALIRHYVLAGESDRAKTAITEAEKNLPPKDASMALAQCYDVMGMTDAAGKKYEEALAAAPNDVAVIRATADFYFRNRKAAPAEPLLLKIIDGKVKADTPDVVWARRQLALIYATRVTYQNLKKAERLIEQNRASSATSTADMQILVRLYASDPDRARRGEAIGMLQDMIKKQLATAEDRFSLAQIFLSMGEWRKASDMMRNLVAEYDKEPGYLIAYVQALLQHGETSDVEGYIARLKKLTSNSFIAIRLQADLLCATKRPQEAFDLLTSFVDRTDVEPKDRSERVRLVADKLAELGRQLAKSDEQLLAGKFFRQAETLYRAYGTEGSGQKLPLAMFLSGLGPDKGDEALDLLDQSLDDSTPFAFARASAAVLDNIAGNKERTKRLEQLVEKALKKFQQPATLLMVMADAYTRQARYAEAEAYYRQVIEKNPNDAVAMNNLGMLLGLQGIKLDEALNLANQAVDIMGPLGPVLDSRACVYLARHELDKALKDIEDALNDKETAVRLFHRAEIYQQLGQENSARTDIFKAVKQLGLTKDMLQPLEVPAFEQLKKLVK